MIRNWAAELVAALLAAPAPTARTWLVGFICPACDTVNTHRCEVAERYCGRCHWWTGDPQRAWGRPDLFRAHGRVPPSPPGVIRGATADLMIVDEAIV